LHKNMQPVGKLFLAVLWAHQLGDFPLQSSSMVRGKRQGTRAYLAHGTIHLLVLGLCVAVFASFRLVTSLSFGMAVVGGLLMSQAVVWNHNFEVVTGLPPPLTHRPSSLGRHLSSVGGDAHPDAKPETDAYTPRQSRRIGLAYGVRVPRRGRLLRRACQIC
jgi:hypothetical protein